MNFEQIYSILWEDYVHYHDHEDGSISHCCYCGPRRGVQENEIIIDCSCGPDYRVERWEHKDGITVYYIWSPGIWNWAPDVTLRKMGFKLVEVIE